MFANAKQLIVRPSSPLISAKQVFHGRIGSRGLLSTSDDTASRRIRVITCDVTGTLVSFLGKIEDHYGNAARTCGIELDPHKMSIIGKCFNQAYGETSEAHPCFGNHTISAKDWWRRCVNRSFELVGTDMSAREQEMWCHRSGIATGVISNADERYGDSILPMLDLGDDMRFLTFSKNVGYEKPGKEIFQAAMKQAEPWLCLVNCNNSMDDAGTRNTYCPPLKPEEVLHIGNDFKKDYLGAKNAGFHAVLLDRYDEKELANSWREKGAPVFKDLIDVVEYLGREQFELGPPQAFTSKIESLEEISM